MHWSLLFYPDLKEARRRALKTSDCVRISWSKGGSDNILLKIRFYIYISTTISLYCHGLSSLSMKIFYGVAAHYHERCPFSCWRVIGTVLLSGQIITYKDSWVLWWHNKSFVFVSPINNKIWHPSTTGSGSCGTQGHTPRYLGGILPTCASSVRQTVFGTDSGTYRRPWPGSFLL